MPALPTVVASAQHGLLTAAQLRSAGFNANLVRGLTKRGHLERVVPRLYRVAGAPETAQQGLLAAVLEVGDGAALSHTTALAWLRLPGFTPNPVHVSRPRGNGRRGHQLAAHVHMVRWLPEQHVCAPEDVPAVVPARALFELASLPGVHRDRIERAIDNAWSRRLVTGRILHTMLEQLEGRRWPRIELMREFLADRGKDYIPPESGLECRVIQILRRAGEPPLRPQANCGDDVAWIARVDFIDNELPFILEVQSDRYHSSRLDRLVDLERITRLEEAGYVVGTVNESAVWHHPDKVVSAVREGRRAARDKLFARA